MTYLFVDVQNCTTAELYERFERLTLQRGLEMMGDEMLKCPRFVLRPSPSAPSYHLFRCNHTVVTDSENYGKTDGDSEYCSFAMCSSCMYLSFPISCFNEIIKKF